MIKISANAFEKLVEKLLYTDKSRAATLLTKRISDLSDSPMFSGNESGILKYIYDTDKNVDPAFFNHAAKTRLRFLQNERNKSQEYINKLLLKTRLKRNQRYKEEFNVPLSPYKHPTIADPEAEVIIHHGGGEHFINEALKGKKGYNLEHSTRQGIQVHPVELMGLDRRTHMYAQRNAPYYFDTPASLTGKIKLKYLTKQPNNFEAGLPLEHMKFIKDPKVKSLGITTQEEFDTKATIDKWKKDYYALKDKYVSI